MSGADICRTDEERRARYINRQTAKENAKNEWRRAERVSNMQQCLEVLTKLRAATVRQVAREMGKNHVTVKSWMQDLHKRKLIYVSDTFRTEESNKPVPAYSVGDKPDKKREKVEPEDDMAAVRKKHEAWKKTWTPHRDPAAAWF